MTTDDHGIEHLGSIVHKGFSLTDAKRLPCGCLIGDQLGTKAFVIDPCSPHCEHYEFAVDESRRLGRPLEFHDHTRRN